MCYFLEFFAVEKNMAEQFIVLSGLTLLVPYLLSRKKRWGRCKVRLFVGGEAQQIDEQKQEYA